MDSLSALRRKDENKGVSGYSPCKIPTVLPEMQKRNKNRCYTTENGIKQMSPTQKVQSLLPMLKMDTQALFFY